MAGCLRGPAGCLARSIALLAVGLSLTCGFATAATAAYARAPAVGHASSALPLGGINIASLGNVADGQHAQAEIAAAIKLHAKLVRVEAAWSTFEPSDVRLDAVALAGMDRLLAAASAAGIRVIVLVDSTPCWASSAPAPLLHRCNPRRTGRANAWPPRHAADYASFVALLAQRYGTRLAAIEVWNEPDQINQLYFAGPHKVARYATILKAAYRAIKQANPQVPVLAGSLVGSNGVFLRALYAAGIKGYYDGLAVHYYTLVLAAVRQIHEVQVRSGDNTPLWLDEFGWSSCYPRHRIEQEQACVTPAIQALNLRDVLRSLAHVPYVAAEVVYDLQDNRAERFGVLTSRGARKPSFDALSGALVSPLANPSAVALSLRAAGGRTIASGSGPVGDIMQLEVFQGSLLRYRALFTLDRFNRYSLALPSVLGTSGLRVRVFQWWAGSARGAQATI
ncbi:MAG TPA: cellulase family glycosylhydrolase [Solirubrobacteraceae bacterium]|nr:cellulase family glycosylhydrolase [Solirubrobacteraceae bacterium]